VMDAARYDISVAVMQDRYDHAFLRNDSRPAAVIIYEGFETDTEDQAFKRQFLGEFSGPDNAGKAMFAEADRGTSGVAAALHIETLGISQRDARSVERYAEKLRGICVAFGVPLTVLGDASGRTFANASEEFRVFWAQTMSNLVAEMQHALNLKLAPLFGDNVCWFDLSKVEALKPKTDPVTAPVTAPVMVQAQLMTINEARADYQLAPVPDGDRFMTAEEITALHAPVPNARTVGDTSQAPPVAPARPVTAESARPQRSPSADTAAVPPPDERRIRRTRAVAQVNVHVGTFEHTWTRTFRALFARQAAEVLQRLKGKRGRQATRETRAEPDGIFRKAHWKAVTAEEVEALLEPVFAAGAGRIAGDFGISFDIETPYVTEFIKNRANQLAGQVTDTTYDQITTALSEGVAAGETIDDIAERVAHVFDIADTVRAETIARTEVISAYNGSSATVAAQLPSDVVGGQEWITTEDARTRPEHAAADGEIVPVGQPFMATGEPMMYPGDPAGSPGNVINCRCTVAFLSPAEMDERSMRVEKRAALALLEMIRPGSLLDEPAFRRALREVRTA
jgi:SPP1 gp7 family putative phage head morphogenesis protein